MPFELLESQVVDNGGIPNNCLGAPSNPIRGCSLLPSPLSNFVGSVCTIVVYFVLSLVALGRRGAQTFECFGRRL